MRYVRCAEMVLARKFEKTPEVYWFRLPVKSQKCDGLDSHRILSTSEKGGTM